jgi:hypothetical protein
MVDCPGNAAWRREPNEFCETLRTIHAVRIRASVDPAGALDRDEEPYSTRVGGPVSRDTFGKVLESPDCRPPGCIPDATARTHGRSWQSQGERGVARVTSAHPQLPEPPRGPGGHLRRDRDRPLPFTNRPASDCPGRLDHQGAATRSASANYWAATAGGSRFEPGRHSVTGADNSGPEATWQ